MNAITQSNPMQNLPVYAVSEARQQLAQQLKDVAGGRKVRRITAANGKFTIHELGADPQYVSAMGLVVLGLAPSMSRAWYSTGFDPKTAGGSPPDCSSFDGKTPHAKSKQIQASSCQMCPRAQKTDRVLPNGQIINSAECGQRYRIIVADPTRLGQPGNLYRLDMNATAYLAQDSVDAGKFAFNSLLKWFSERNAAGHAVLPQNALIGFTFPNRPAAQGHFQVEILQWLPPEMAALAENLALSDDVRELLFGDEYLEAENQPAPVAAPAQAPVAAPVAVPAQAPVAAPVAAPAQAPVAAPVAAPVGRPRSRRTPPAEQSAPAQTAPAGFGAPAAVAAPAAPAASAAPAPAGFGGAFGAPAPVAAPAAPAPAPQNTGTFNPFAGFGTAV